MIKRFQDLTIVTIAPLDFSTDADQDPSEDPTDQLAQDQYVRFRVDQGPKL
jgi:hypothetical protein